MTRTIKIIILIVLFAIPVVWLVFKATRKPGSDKEQVVASPEAKPDIAALEIEVNKNPNFDNLIKLSLAYINNGTAIKSIDPLKKAIKLNPNSAVAYNDLGVAYIMLGHPQDGIDACNKAISIDNNFQLAKNNLKWGMDERDKLLQAIHDYDQVPANKRDVNYYMNYGMTYFKAGNYDKSIEIWGKIGDLDKKNTAALNNIGTAFMMKNQIGDAIAMFKRAMEINPADQLAKNNLAWALEEEKKAGMGKQ